MVNLTTGIMILIFICMRFWVWGILRSWTACAPTAHELVCDCRNLRNTALRKKSCGKYHLRRGKDNQEVLL
jgi:hypothetical protein